MSTTRRQFLAAFGWGVAGTVVVGALTGSEPSGRPGLGRVDGASPTLALVATDGYITVPHRAAPLYIFGFAQVDPAKTVRQLSSANRGRAQHTAPMLDFKQEEDVRITLTNLGSAQRPDLDDAHTVHWHGFDMPTPLNDGVPEMSVAVPVGKRFTYFYRPHRPGTYMYHCHFEDVEHVQMGMTGIVFVRPTQDGTAFTYRGRTFTTFAYNDGDGSTGYDRHFAILLNEIEEREHDRGGEEFIPTDYDPKVFTLNGRCYPQTVLPNDGNGTTSKITTANPSDHNNPYASQPNSALIQVNPGDRALLRLANLGYQQHAMQLPGIPMHVIGQDASLLRNGGVDASYWTNTLYIGPGEARDVLFDAPAYDAARPSGADARGNYNVYYFKNRDYRKLSNRGARGPGGMMTEVRVYQNPLPVQSVVGQTYG